MHKYYKISYSNRSGKIQSEVIRFEESLIKTLEKFCIENALQLDDLLKMKVFYM